MRAPWQKEKVGAQKNPVVKKGVYKTKSAFDLVEQELFDATIERTAVNRRPSFIKRLVANDCIKIKLTAGELKGCIKLFEDNCDDKEGQTMSRTRFLNLFCEKGSQNYAETVATFQQVCR